MGARRADDDDPARSPEVVRATAADAAVLGGVLGRAFVDDPVWRWVYPHADRSVRLARMFTALVEVTLAGGATVLTDRDRRSAAIWQRSERLGVGVRGNVRMGAAMVRSGARLRRGRAFLSAIERHHPTVPHWYLAVLGTDPAAQGTGLGSALVRHVIEASGGRDAAYLETETAANVPFYRRHGFDVVGEIDVPRGGPHLWLMWRDATSGAGPAVR
jgi:ribosomal protein S18 acetylase RimI-like enzyme